MLTSNCFINAKKISNVSYLFLFLFFIFQSCKHSKETTKTASNKTAPKNADIVAQALGVNEKEIRESKLYKFIGEWYGTAYKYGGCDKNGIDCSCFTGTLYREIYGKTIARSAKDIYKDCNRVKESHLKEGDLLFFKIGSKEITHVGVFLKERKFVHASTKKGVMISNLDEDFFKKVFYEAGRLK